MLRLVVGTFLVLHGLVHLLYFGQSAKYFELKPGMVWPDGSWTIAKLLGDPAARTLAGMAMILAALLFLAGGIGLFASQAWWRPAVVSAGVFSTLIYVLFWNGRMQNLDGQGGVGILINLAILIAVLGFQWRALDF